MGFRASVTVHRCRVGWCYGSICRHVTDIRGALVLGKHIMQILGERTLIVDLRDHRRWPISTAVRGGGGLLARYLVEGRVEGRVGCGH